MGCGLTLLSLCRKVCSRVEGGGSEHVPTCLKYHLLASPMLYILCSKLLYYQPVHLHNENERIPIWALFLLDLPQTFPGSLPCLMLQVPAAWYFGSYVPCKNRFFFFFRTNRFFEPWTPQTGKNLKTGKTAPLYLTTRPTRQSIRLNGPDLFHMTSATNPSCFSGWLLHTLAYFSHNQHIKWNSSQGFGEQHDKDYMNGSNAMSCVHV